jgi:single-stranded DNA-binding protein
MQRTPYKTSARGLSIARPKRSACGCPVRGEAGLAVDAAFDLLPWKSINELMVAVIGDLQRDLNGGWASRRHPVRRETRTGKEMVAASAAVNVAKPGEERATEWIGLVAFGGVAESLERHAKGDVIMVMGPLTRSTSLAAMGRSARAGLSLRRRVSRRPQSMSNRENGAIRARPHDREEPDLLPGHSIPRHNSQDARPQICPMTALAIFIDERERGHFRPRRTRLSSASASHRRSCARRRVLVCRALGPPVSCSIG